MNLVVHRSLALPVSINGYHFIKKLIHTQLSTAGMTTGTPIHVFVPNTDQRGHVSTLKLWLFNHMDIKIWAYT